MYVFIQGSAGKKGARGLSGAPGIEVSITSALNQMRGSKRISSSRAGLKTITQAGDLAPSQAAVMQTIS